LDAAALPMRDTLDRKSSGKSKRLRILFVAAPNSPSHSQPLLVTYVAAVQWLIE